MKYRTLGKTGLKVSVVGIGTWQFGGEWGKTFEQAEADAMFRRGRELGLNLIDTAECYGDHLSERLIGNAIAAERDAWVVCTKFGHKFHGYMNRTDERAAKDVRPQIEASLTALRTDHIDVLQYHSVRNVEFDDPAVRDELAKLVREGKVRFIGTSISPNDNVHQVDNAAAARVSVVQVIYNRLDHDKPDAAVLPSCQRQNLGVLARVPLASGLLSGKYEPGYVFPPDDVRHGRDPQVLANQLREVEEIREAEVPVGTSLATWALAWCLQHPAVSAVIPGCKSVQQIEQNSMAADLDIVRPDHPQAWPAA